MRNQIFEYQSKISYHHFISPLVGAGLIYVGYANQGGLAYKGKLIMTYPGSAFFLTIIGSFFIIPLIFVLIKSFKKNSIKLGDGELSYTKGTLISVEKTVKYSDFKDVYFEDSEDDGNSIVIDSDTFFDHHFYANNFKSPSDYTDFCEQITACYKNTSICE